MRESHIYRCRKYIGHNLEGSDIFWNPKTPHIRPHQINFMDDGFSAEKKWSEFSISPKNGAIEEATIFFLKKLISRKNGASEVANVFFKERNVTLT